MLHKRDKNVVREEKVNYSNKLYRNVIKLKEVYTTIPKLSSVMPKSWLWPFKSLQQTSYVTIP